MIFPNQPLEEFVGMAIESSVISVEGQDYTIVDSTFDLNDSTPNKDDIILNNLIDKSQKLSS